MGKDVEGNGLDRPNQFLLTTVLLLTSVSNSAKLK